MDAADVGAIPNAQKGAANGVAELDSGGKVPASQLPSYVDDVLEYATCSAFPATGETGKIYVATDTNLTYRWTGSGYTEISPSLALGETSSTAYRGDRGKIAYDHAQARGSAYASGFYLIQTNAEGHVIAATPVTKANITALGIPAQDTTYDPATQSTPGLMSATDKAKLDKYGKAHYGGTGNTTKIKIKINSTASWMLSFVVNLYQGYNATKVQISGYNYQANHWYQPEAVLLASSDNKAVNVYFGYDGTGQLWVGFDGGNYTGCSVTDVTNGYSQIADFTGLFTISNVSSLATLQATVTAYCHQYVAAPAAGQVLIANDANGGIKTSGYTIAKSVPSNAVFTDHYAWSDITGKPNRAGSDSDGGPAQTVKGAYTANGGRQNPNYFGVNKVGFLMMNTTVNNNSQYKDWLIMDCYNGSDVGGGVAIGVNRQALGAYIMRSAAARSAWAESAELLGTHNYTSYCPTKTGSGASGTWGINVTGNAANVTGTVAVANGGTGATAAGWTALSNLGLQYVQANVTFSNGSGSYDFGKDVHLVEWHPVATVYSFRMNRAYGYRRYDFSNNTSSSYSGTITMDFYYINK